MLVLSLAIFDTAYHIAVCGKQEGILRKIGYQETLINCQIINFVSHLFRILSSWLVVFLFFERFVCIQWPIYSHVRWKKLLIVMWKMLLIFSGISSDVFQSSSVIENNNSSQCVHRLSSPANLDLSMFLLLGGPHSTVPAIIALILNVLIINALIRQNRDFNRGTTNPSREVKKAQSITRMLIAVSFLLVACRLPYHFTVVVDIVSKHVYKFDIVENYGYILGICHILSVVDHVWNLFVYLLGSSMLKAQAMSQLSCWRLK